LSLFSLLRHIKSFNWIASVGNSQILNEREISRPVRNSGKFPTNSSSFSSMLLHQAILLNL
jgi:hypothetical protein